MPSAHANTAEFGEDDLRVLFGEHAGGGRLELGDPFTVEPLGVFFAPDCDVWSVLEPEEQSAIAPPEGLGEHVAVEGVQPYWRRVLPFPFTPPQLLQFAEYAQLPGLCRWLEADLSSVGPPARGAFRELEDRHRALSLAAYLAGGPDPRGHVIAGGNVAGTPSKRGPRKGSKSEAFQSLLSKHPDLSAGRVNALLPEPMDEATARRLARQHKAANKR